MMTEHPEAVKTYLAGLYNEHLRRLACRASSTDEYWKNIALAMKATGSTAPS